MSRESLVFCIGFLVFLTSYFGIPTQYKEYIFIGSGILLMVIGYSLRRSAFLRSLEDEHGERRSEVFVEYKGSKEQTTPLQE